MFARWKMRKVFRMGGATYEHATYITKRKTVWMVMYLRSRRGAADLSNPPYRRESELWQKRWARRVYLGIEKGPPVM